MLLIRLLRAELGADDRDDGRKCVREIVYRIEDDGDGVGDQSDEGFKSDEKEVRHDADDAGPDDGFLSVFGHDGDIVILFTHISTPLYMITNILWLFTGNGKRKSVPVLFVRKTLIILYLCLTMSLS